MEIVSDDGALFALTVVGYEFPDLEALAAADPDAEPDEDDLNWLVVRGEVTTADGTHWSFEDGCLTAWEAADLGAWLRAVADGVPADVTDAWLEDGRISFTEPALAFDLADAPAPGRVVVRVALAAEALPPDADTPTAVTLTLVTTTDALAVAATRWTRALSKHPPR
ncbi:hypothetical protein [Kineosporia sp. A_224]|uniref:WapI family immunity protein n=1 Tax=Kineosporia sp. A_224 TaxID=1962180 RepID=UPI000B4BB488|nr:hypothetical protein [Kineosporia sp. A_224]